MINEETKKKLQEKYIEFQLLQQQIQEVQEQRRLITQRSMEINETKNSLDELSNVEKDKYILSQLGSGTIIKTKLVDSKKVFVNAGANVLVLKTISEAKEFMDKQLKELDEALNNVDYTLNKAREHLHTLQKSIVELSKE